MTRVLVVTVGAGSRLHRAAWVALRQLTDGSGRTLDQDPAPPGGSRQTGPVYQEAVRRARSYLDRMLPDDRLTLVPCRSLAEVPARVAARSDPAADDVLALLLIDAPRAGLAGDVLDPAVPRALAAAVEGLAGTVRVDPSVHSLRVYDDRADTAGVRVGRPYTLKALPEDDRLLSADVVVALTDFVQSRLAGVVARGGGDAEPALAAALAGFLTAEAADRWALHPYTGSAVSALIEALERYAGDNGNLVLRGPGENSLAAAALARWQLDAAPFLVVATSGMADEFRGTLANLRDARAAGFLVLAEAAAGWYPFQGTVHAAEDARQVLRARGIPTVHLTDPDQVGTDLAEAFAAYRLGTGPVALLVAPAVLQRTEPVRLPVPPPRPAPAVVDEGPLDRAVALVNTAPARLLWVCGAVPPADTGLLLDLAHRAGIALADTITRPGVVARFHAGRRVEEYLGTLSLYGYSARVHAFLHEQGRLRPPAEQALFFLGSRIAQVVTPFSGRALRSALRIVQVTREPAHLAPFADLPVPAEVSGFLRAVRDRLAVPGPILQLRRDAIAATRDSASDVVSGLPLQPMSPNYFFARLGDVLTDLIETEGYEYTGVYDVGRGGASAIRNLPRTGPGLSGWYGRALMGEAMQAVPAVALSRPGNVLAFVGDGAAAMGPDVLPVLVQQVCMDGLPLTGNLSIFRLLDGGHSIIRSHHESRRGRVAGQQTTVLSLVEDDWQRRYGQLDVLHRRIADVDAPLLRKELQQPGQVNLYSVLLGHNSEGDGMSLLSSFGWQRDEVPPLAFGIGSGRRTAR